MFEKQTGGLGRPESCPGLASATFLGQPSHISEGCQVGASCSGTHLAQLRDTSLSRAERKQ